MIRRHALTLCALVALAVVLPPAALAQESHALIVYTAFFDKHASSVTADDVKVLGMLARLTRDDPTYRIRVVAYTDPTEEDKKDEALARRRAEAVLNFMVGSGVGADQIEIRGVGDEESFGKDKAETDKALRRRAEIRIRQEGRDRRAIDSDLEKDADTKIQTTVFFDFDKAEIRPEFRELLARFGRMLSHNHSYKLRLFGHTDGVGSRSYNLDLGERRCKAVLEELRAAGAMETDVEIASLGEQETIGSQAMKATTSRALSRSVEIKVIKVPGGGGPVAESDEPAPPDESSGKGKGKGKGKSGKDKKK
ncbi:MAG: OmpA family protein [Acidobacteria bacterium]|nr:OmpA family protein [Acidobacteriota bacterium]